MNRVSLSLGLAALIMLAGCTTKKENITQVIGPKDWQPPVLVWQSLPDAEVRGTVGLDVSVTDSSAIPMVKLYVDGAQRDSLTVAPYRFSLNTDSLLDGVHLCEARAWDQYGNLGISPVLRVNVMNSVAQGPRLIWVPDSFATVQAAINAATDFDTIRVRDGTYYETLNTFGKGIWIESEHGPLHSTINAAGSSRSIVASPGNTVTTIRGFWVTGGIYGISIDNVRVNVFNNIFESDTSEEALLITSYAGGTIRNNLFDGAQYGVEMAYFWGAFRNNILQNVHNAAMWNAAVRRNPIEYGYNLFWANGHNYDQFSPGVGDVYGNPLLDMANGRLLANSPAIDTGDPSVTDRDGSRSDIGPFGGPWAY